mgnify:CR=1 FL=1
MGKTRAGRFALRGQRMALLHLETMTQAVDSADSVDPRALEALNRYFGYDSFRPGQSGIVSAILTGHDVLGVMPTGAGKSICYQIPAAILPGVAIVISPLISLMRDQVDALNDVGLPAAFINTTQTPDEQDLVFAQALSGQIKLLYVAPERLETERFRNFAVRVPISLVAVDEAHCVSQWGQDFRSSYLGIGEFIAGLPTRPTVAAFTATATERVRRDIVSILGLHTPSITVTGFDRPNLYFDVISMPRKDKASWVASYIASHPDESGIVYCATRKETEALAESLNSAVAELRAAGGADVSDIGTIAVAYHGGMSADAREKAQRDFVTDRVPVVVATNAFGMGIDKSNVRFVIHHNMPESIEAYYQEAGRAGRDGEPSRCTLLWNESDIVTRRRLLDSDYENERLTPEEQEAVRASKRRLLDAMVGYRNDRYRNFGWAAAKVDDLANWVPARLTAALTVLAAPLVGGRPADAVDVVRLQADRHPSPNGGVVEGAFAGALGVTLGGRNSYGGVAEDRGELGTGPAPTPADLARANRLALAVSALAALATAGLAAGLTRASSR